MKKLVILILTLALVLSLAACGGNAPATDPATDPVTDPVTDPATDPATEPAAEPAGELVMTDVYAKLLAAADVPEMIELDEGLMLDYCGIAAQDVKQAVVVICADSLRTDEIWLLEAVDEAAMDRLARLANSRLEAKAEESITYSSEQYAVVEKAQMICTGNYLALLVSPDVDALVAAFHAEAGI